MKSSMCTNIERLNQLCKGTLTIIHYTTWEIASYGDNTPLCGSSCVRAVNLNKGIDRAISIALKTESEELK
jgi:hypothetical protein